jgi:hypothetical protein
MLHLTHNAGFAYSFFLYLHIYKLVLFHNLLNFRCLMWPNLRCYISSLSVFIAVMLCLLGKNASRMKRFPCVPAVSQLLSGRQMSAMSFLNSAEMLLSVRTDTKISGNAIRGKTLTFLKSILAPLLLDILSSFHYPEEYTF